MAILSFKVVSYLKSTGGQPYVHGYYDTEEHAKARAADCNAMFKKGGDVLIARVEPVYC